MTKKTRGSKEKAAKGKLWIGDDTVSEKSEDTTHTEEITLDEDINLGEDTTLSMEEKLDLCMESMNEERNTQRLLGLKNLYQLSLAYIPKLIYKTYITDIKNSLLSCLQRYPNNAEEEAKMALYNLSYMILTLGDEIPQSILHELVSFLKPFILDHILVENSLSSLAFEVYVLLANFDEEVNEYLKFCEIQIEESTESTLLPKALECWGYLASLLTLEEIIQRNSLMLLKKFFDFLNTKSQDVRMLAGENMALVVEGLYASKEYIMEDNDEKTEEKEYQKDESKLNMTPYLAKTLELSKQSTKNLSKRTRKEQKSSFREVYKTLKEGEGPSGQFAVVDEVIRYCNWQEYKQLMFIKRSLRGGFHRHIQENNVVRQLLSLPTKKEISSAPLIDNLRMKESMSKKSSMNKTKTESIKQQRSRKMNMRTAYFDED